MEDLNKLVALIEDMPQEPYGFFTDEEQIVIEEIKILICGTDEKKLSLLNALIKSHCLNAECKIAFDNAGEDA